MLDIVRAEIERVLDDKDLAELGRTVLGLDGPFGSKAAVAAALVEHYAKRGALAALCDALAAVRPGLDPRLQAVREGGFVLPDRVPPGTSLGPFIVEGVFGESPSALILVARKGNQRVRLRLVRRELEGRHAAVERFLTAARLAGSIASERLPRIVMAGRIGDRVGTVHELVVGLPLTERHEVPVKLRDTWPILREILHGLAELHRRGLAHGSLHARNVLQTAAGGVLLLDAGAHHLYERGRATAPEQVVGGPTTPATDVYAFGALLYCTLSGRPLHPGSEREAAAAMLGKDFEPLGVAAPRGWILAELDELVVRMLDRDPGARPPTADALLDALETIASHSVRRDSTFPDLELDDHIAALLDDPTDATAASFEALVNQGADAERVAEALRLAAEQLDGGDAKATSAKKQLLMRSGALFEHAAENPKAAEQSYRMLAGLDPDDAAAEAALERILRRLGRYDAVVDLYVRQADRVEAGKERARVFARLGELLASTLGETDQAIVAYTQAFVEDPLEPVHAEHIERLAGSNARAFEDILATCADAARAQRDTEAQNALLGRMGRWYAERVGKPDLALGCFQAILAADPANKFALSKLADIYRRSLQWRELVETLRLLADAQGGPAEARELRARAAEILETRLGDATSAAELYEQILADDPGNQGAGRALARLYLEGDKLHDYERVQRCRAEAGEKALRAEIFCELGRALEERLGDAAEARSAYEEALRAYPDHLGALERLERIYIASSAFSELVSNLERQIALSIVPHRKVKLLERIVAIHEREFMDTDKAISALERILQVDPLHEGALDELERLHRSLGNWPALAATYERHLAQLREPASRVGKLVELAALMKGELDDPAHAMTAYEAVLAINPAHAEAADALAQLLMRAGDRLEQSGDLAGAIERYRRALHVVPANPEAALCLRRALVAQGNAALVADMLEKDIRSAPDSAARARLCVELSFLLRDRLSDPGRAAAAAARALEHDPSNLEATALLADLERHAGRVPEAMQLYDRAVLRLEALSHPEAIWVLVGRAETRGRSGDTKGALADAETLAARFPNDASALRHAARLLSEYGPPSRAEAVAADLLEHFGTTLSEDERAEALYYRGRSLLSMKRPDAAIPLLEQAAYFDRTAEAPLHALAELYRGEGNWVELARVLARLLHRVEGDRRADVLVEMGDLAAKTLKSPNIAARSYLAALAERSEDRRILLKLTQLYNKEHDWAHLVEVILRLSKVTDNAAERAQHLQTAARIAAYEIADLPRAIDLIDEALAAYPSNEAVLRDAVELRTKAGDSDGIHRLLERQIEAAAKAHDKGRALDLATELADLYLAELDVDDAIAVNEAALALDPADQRREEVLADLYAAEPTKNLRRAISLEMRAVRRDPLRPESYEAMRAMYERAGHTDGTFCACQALAALDRASREERLFYESRRGAGLLRAHGHIADSDWNRLVAHPDMDPTVTAIFTEIQPIVLSARGEPIARAQTTDQDPVDLSERTEPLPLALRRGAELIRIPPPLVLRDSRARAPVCFGGLEHRALLVADSALGPNVPLGEAAFVAGAHLVYFRPGLYVRAFLSTIPALKAWMLAAARLIAPRLSVPEDLEGLIADASRVLSQGLSGILRDRLAQPISELMRNGGKADVGRWVRGVDMTSDRVGFILCDDLETAVELIRRAGDRAASVPVAERVRELLAYSVSPEYIELRARLGVAHRTERAEQPLEAVG